MPQNWEADKMLDVYIYDYLIKRNLQASAKAFQTEGKVSPEPVAIDAPEGFLFEWWSVFWDIFMAQMNEKHSEVASSYIDITAMTDSGKQSLVIAPLSNGEAAKMENGTSEASLTEFSGQQEPKLLDACEDNYDGVTVELDNVPLDVDGFVSSLRVSLSKWAQQGKKGVWIKVPKNHAKLVPAVIEEGFSYHHAECDYVMLVYWIPKSPCTLPANASHQVGVGGFVMNDNRELLVVQEKNGPYRGSGIWKWPTGLLHQGEDIIVGAIREVKEETGIDTEFVEVGGIGHCHHAPFDKSDLCFMCILRPLSFDIKIQESEIAAARWMPIEEFARQPIYQDIELYKKALDVCIASSEKRCKGFSAVKLASRSTVHPSVFYYNDQDTNGLSLLNGAIP